MSPRCVRTRAERRRSSTVDRGRSGCQALGRRLVRLTSTTCSRARPAARRMTMPATREGSAWRAFEAEVVAVGGHARRADRHRRVLRGRRRSGRGLLRPRILLQDRRGRRPPIGDRRPIGIVTGSSPSARTVRGRFGARGPRSARARGQSFFGGNIGSPACRGCRRGVRARQPAGYRYLPDVVLSAQVPRWRDGRVLLPGRVVATDGAALRARITPGGVVIDTLRHAARRGRRSPNVGKSSL